MADLLLPLATGIISVLVFAYTFHPLLRRLSGRPRPGLAEPTDAAERRWDDLFAQRDALLVAIDELDFDQAVGKIEASVYQPMRQRLVDQALIVLKQIDEASGVGAVPAAESRAGGADPAAEIERRIAEMRRTIQGTAVSPGSTRRRTAWLVGGATVTILFAAAVLVTAERVRQVIGSPVAVGMVPAAARAGLAIDTGDPRLLYYGYAGGVFVSRDGGRSWASSPSAPRGATAVAATGGERRLVLAAAQGGVYASDDEGARWERLTTVPTATPRLVAVSAAEPTVVYVVSEDGEGLRSDDAGTGWVTVAAPMPAGVTGLAVVDTPRLYAATSEDGVFATVDGGQLWTKANGFVTGLLPTLNVRGIAYDRNSGDAAIFPSGARFTGALYLATDLGVFRSRDGGIAWEPLSLRVPTVAVAVDPQDSRIIYTVDDRGNVYKSADRGVSWRAS